jgi:4-hydroxy-2-oxoheptanedioate aldolase
MKNLKQRIQRGETVIGCWINLGSSLSAEMVGLAGFDWVLIDLEHGAGTEKDVLFQLQALEHGTAAPIIRVEGFERQRIHRVLDYGAEGIMCPRIKTAAEAKQAANAMRYTPEGLRGVAKMVRATNFGVNFDAYLAGARENLVGVIQIETEEALGCLDDIAATEGVDVLFIGPSDLTMALGIFGQFDHPRFIDALKATADAAGKAGKATGVLLYNPDHFGQFHRLGFTFIASGADAGFVNAGARAMVKKLSDFRLEFTAKKS